MIWGWKKRKRSLKVFGVLSTALAAVWLTGLRLGEDMPRQVAKRQQADMTAYGSINPAGGDLLQRQQHWKQHDRHTTLAALPADASSLTPPVQPAASPHCPLARPCLAIIIDDMGMNSQKTEAVNALPAPLTLSYLSYAPNLAEQTKASQAAGHELFVHIPMQPHDAGQNPGIQALLVTDTPAQLAEKTRWHFSRFSGFTGFNNHMGSLFTENAAAVTVLLHSIPKRDIIVVDSVTSNASVLAAQAGALGMQHLTRDVFLDHIDDADVIRTRLIDAASIARQRGYAVAIGHPYPSTIRVLAEELPDLQKDGFALVGVRELFRQSQADVARKP